MLEPELRIVTVPTDHPTGSFGRNIGMQPPGGLELQHPVRFFKAFFHIPVRFQVLYFQVVFREILWMGKGCIGFQGLFHIQQERTFFPFNLDQS
ncbi:MAG: hypothetical protein JRF52_12700 [Deltaproteobacteria bacterium]|nr:hypothetical protein [Deltaproteobacteria bacterium]